MKNIALFIAFSICSLMLTAQEKGTTNTDSISSVKTPVIFKADTLFYLQSAPKNVTVTERAFLISNRLNEIVATENSFNEKAFLTKQDTTTGNYIVSYSNRIICSLTNEDAIAAEKPLKDLSVDYSNIIKDRLLKYYAFTGTKNIFISLVEALGIIAVLVLFIIGVNKAYRKLFKRFVLKKSFKPLHTGKYELVSPKQIKYILGRITGILRWLFILLVIYLALPLIFSLFPWTRGIANQLISYVIEPFMAIIHSAINYLPNLLTVIIISLFAHYTVKLIGYFAREIEKGILNIPGFYADWAMPTFKIVKALLYIFAFIVIFPYLPGSQSKVFQGVSVFLGILFSLGSSSAIANVVAGVVITYMRPFKIGDSVKIGDVVGDVIEKTLLVTRVRTIKNEEVTIPNSTILSAGTINYSSCAKKEGLILHSSVTIGYDVPWRLVHDLLIKAASQTIHVLQQPHPFVLQTSLDDYYVAYQINLYTDRPEIASRIRSSLHQNILDVFNDAGVEIMSPAYHSLRDGNTVTIPEDKRPEDYQPDGFIIRQRVSVKPV